MKKRMLSGALVAALLLGLGCCLALAGEMLRRVEGRVEIETVTFAQGRGKLYLPQAAGAGDTCAGALILTGGFDGGDALAAELARRGVAALTVKGDAAGAWEYLRSQAFTDPERIGIFAAGDRAGAALALAEDLAAAGTPCAGLVLLAGGDLAERAGAFSGANLLLLTKKLSPEARRAFFGAETGPEKAVTGYFSEGTARSARRVGGLTLGFFREDVMALTLDWQGSCLGHATGLEDHEFLYPTAMFSRWAAMVCLLAAAAAGGGSLWRRRRAKAV